MKKIFALILCLLMLGSTVYASDTGVSAVVKSGDRFDVTVTTAPGVSARIFVYTYTLSDTGHVILNNVSMTAVPFGSSKMVTINPPQDGYYEKLAIVDGLTLEPLCKSYLYPYMANIITEPQGYILKNVGTTESGGKTYASNEYEIVQLPPEAEAANVEVLGLRLYMEAMKSN